MTTFFGIICENPVRMPQLPLALLCRGCRAASGQNDDEIFLRGNILGCRSGYGVDREAPGMSSRGQKKGGSAGSAARLPSLPGERFDSRRVQWLPAEPGSPNWISGFRDRGLREASSDEGKNHLRPVCAALRIRLPQSQGRGLGATLSMDGGCASPCGPERHPFTRTSSKSK